METRKTQSADLERKRPVFLQLGLIIAISAALAAFEWKTPNTGKIVLPPVTTLEPETEIIDIVVEKKTEFHKPVNTTILKEVKNNLNDLPYIEILIETDPFERIEPYILPEQSPEEADPNEPEIFLIAEQMPEFPGGEVALLKYLGENTGYPEIAREAGISGIVYVSFIVEPDGSISSIRAQREIPGGCTEEAIRVVREMPRWLPGRQRGKAVRVNMNLPVYFKLLN
ncbi:MAG: energy transducer TonB [Bacteroidota bacterium]